MVCGMDKLIMKYLFLALSLTILACTSTIATVTPALQSGALGAEKMLVQVTALPRQMMVCKTDPAHGLNLRTYAGQSYKSLGVYPNGTVVTLTGAETVVTIIPWYQVKIGNVTGWMRSDYLCNE
jgi:uncharacterized protein YgiM (DUF1202 family)